jgi:hypothetical protein
VLAYYINSGNYGETPLDGLNLLMVGSFKGNAWQGESKDARMGFFFDERGNEKQREALQMIFREKAGGFYGRIRLPRKNEKDIMQFLKL